MYKKLKKWLTSIIAKKLIKENEWLTKIIAEQEEEIKNLKKRILHLYNK